MFGTPSQDPSYLQLARVIQDHCGINYTDNLAGLGSKVNGRIKELGVSVWGYIDYLSTNGNEWALLAELVTINETYFFREEHQLHVLRTALLPVMRAAPKPLRIWSAACSSGDEPYSIAMGLWEDGVKPGQVEILGTDINRKVLQTAQKGWYHQNSLCFRRTCQTEIGKYFVRDDRGYTVRSEIRDMVRFQELNLMDSSRIRELGQMDIIFCRNVLIYFDETTTRRVIQSFYDRLKPGGYLFLGHAETLGSLKDQFETIHAPSTFYYRKGGG